MALHAVRLRLWVRSSLRLRPAFFSLRAHATRSSEPTSKDEYFFALHQVCNVVRRDFYMERTLQRMGVKPTTELVYRVLRACARSGIESLRFFNWARTHPSYHPTSAEYEQLIRILGDTRHWEHMWTIAEQMRSADLSLSLETLAGVISSYGDAGLLDRAVDVFNRIPRLLGRPQTLSAYNSLLSALCRARHFRGAYALVRRMARRGVPPDKTTFGTLVNAWCAEGKLKEALGFLEEMARRGFRPPVRGRDLLVEGLINAGFLETAKGLVRRMTKEGVAPDLQTLNSLLASLCNSGEVGFTVDLLNSVEGLGVQPDLETYKIMIPATARAGRVEDAFRVLNRAMEDGHRPFPGLYAPVMKALCKQGRFDDAFAFFADMKAEGHPPNRPVYTMLVRMCCRAGRIMDSANLLFEMVERGLSPRGQSFEAVLEGLRSRGNYDLAKRVEQLEVAL